MSTRAQVRAIPSPPTSDSFEDTAIRHRFIRNVVGLIIVQLSLSIASAALTFKFVGSRRMTNETVILFVPAVLIATYLINLILILWDSGLPARRPSGIILFSVLTVSLAAVFSVVFTAIKRPSVADIALQVGIIVFLFCVAIVIYCSNTKYYLISCQGLMFCLLVGLVSLAVFVTGSSGPIYESAGASLSLLFMFALVFDLHRMIRLSPVTGLSPENYLLGAFKVHYDFIWLFVAVLPYAHLIPVSLTVAILCLWSGFVMAKNFRQWKELRRTRDSRFSYAVNERTSQF